MAKSTNLKRKVVHWTQYEIYKVLGDRQVYVETIRVKGLYTERMYKIDRNLDLNVKYIFKPVKKEVGVYECPIEIFMEHAKKVDTRTIDLTGGKTC